MTVMFGKSLNELKWIVHMKWRNRESQERKRQWGQMVTGLNANARKWGLFPGQPGGTGGHSLSSKPGWLCPCSHLATANTATLDTQLSPFFFHLAVLLGDPKALLK